MAATTMTPAAPQPLSCSTTAVAPAAASGRVIHFFPRWKAAIASFRRSSSMARSYGTGILRRISGDPRFSRFSVVPGWYVVRMLFMTHSPVELRQELCGLEAEVSVLRVRQAVIVNELDKVNMAAADGYRSMPDWVSGTLDVSLIHI